MVLPSVIDRVAQGLVQETVGPSTMVGSLREVIEIQRLRGRGADQVLEDFRFLSDVLFDVLREETRGNGAASAAEAVDVAARLNDNMRSIDRAILHAFEEANRKELPEVRGHVEEFVRTLSHEIKNPLGAAEIAAQMLLDDEAAPAEADRQRYAEMIVRNLERGHALIAEMRERALPDLSFTPSEAQVPLASVLDDVFSEVLRAAEGKGVRLEIASVPDQLLVHAHNARLVLMNLTWNGVKYSDPEKPDRWVHVRVQPGEGAAMWTVRVEDNGIGIPDELKDQVFERFVRVHPEHASGAGLGLAIAREAAEEIGGGSGSKARWARAARSS